MTRKKLPVLATWLLDVCGADEALIGDLVEGYIAGHSRAWYWRQVLMAAGLTTLRHLDLHRLGALRIAAIGAATAWFFTYAAAGTPVDLTTGVQVESLWAGWADAGVSDGRNKIVPALSFTLKNVSAEPLAGLQVNALFHRVDAPYEWGNGFVQTVTPRRVSPGESTDTIVVQSSIGYTGADPPLDLLNHSQFVDATVALFAKSGSGNWTPLGEFPVTRQPIVP
jgi:hypothetical protein